MRTRVVATVAALSLLAGCGSGFRSHTSDERQAPGEQSKITVEAYLFDAKLRRRGKPTSFRLEVFQTDSVIALGGRAYLGKGALKGLLTADSLEVYFPSSNEYLYESLSDLFLTAECPQTPTGFSLLDLFASLPDSLENLEDVSITADYTNDKRPEFAVSLPDCPWVIEITYDRHETGWRIRDFEFDSGNDVTLRARRRTYKAKVQAPNSKFQLVISDSATRITP